MADFDFGRPVSAAIFGASGGLGRAFVDLLAADRAFGDVYAVSRTVREDVPAGVTALGYDPDDPADLGRIAGQMPDDLSLVIVTIGTLHDGGRGPEKALRQLQMDRFLEVMRVNAGLPMAMAIADAVAPLMRREGRRIFATLSARVGSISDNHIGGWYSYRSSKAALNQLVRTWSVELARQNEDAVAVTLHPGTVDTDLSSPFQGNVPEGKLFTPADSAARLLTVLAGLAPSASGRCFDYAGEEVAP